MSLNRALKWSFLAELTSKAIQPIVFVVLARMLAPDDFGVMSAALMVIAFSQIFWEAGMGKALIQRQTDIKVAANAAFWINIGLGSVIAGLLVVVAEPVAVSVFHDYRVTAVLQVMALQILLGSISSVHAALLQKNMGFQRLFWVRLTTISLPGLASIPLAWNGMGYWALVIGTLIGQLAQALIIWRLSAWRPTISFNSAVANEMWRFGIWAGLSGLLAWLYTWADALIVGIYLGSHDLGVYRTGNYFVVMVFAIFFSPITPVLYSHLAKLQGDRGRLGQTMEWVTRLLILVAVPAAMVLLFMSGLIGSVLFGATWEPIGMTIGIMALSNGFAWIVGMNGEAYRAMNKPQYETLVMGTAIIVYLPLYMVSIRYGFEIFLWTRLLATLIGIGVQLYFMSRLLHLKTTRLIGYCMRIVVISLLCMTPIHMLGFGTWHVSPVSQQILAAILSIILMVASLYALERNGLLKDARTILSEKYGGETVKSSTRP